MIGGLKTACVAVVMLAGPVAGRVGLRGPAGQLRGVAKKPQKSLWRQVGGHTTLKDRKKAYEESAAAPAVPAMVKRTGRPLRLNPLEKFHTEWHAFEDKDAKLQRQQRLSLDAAFVGALMQRGGYAATFDEKKYLAAPQSLLTRMKASFAEEKESEVQREEKYLGFIEGISKMFSPTCVIAFKKMEDEKDKKDKQVGTGDKSEKQTKSSTVKATDGWMSPTQAGKQAYEDKVAKSALQRVWKQTKEGETVMYDIAETLKGWKNGSDSDKERAQNFALVAARNKYVLEFTRGEQEEREGAEEFFKDCEENPEKYIIEKV